jgi:hypothetical protein
VPTGNVDLAPTILHLLGVAPQPGMSGRILYELLRDSELPADVAVKERTFRSAVTLPGGLRYEAELDIFEVGSTVYLRGARTTRQLDAGAGNQGVSATVQQALQELFRPRSGFHSGAGGYDRRSAVQASE